MSFTLLSVEGNIGAGKSTFLSVLRKALEACGINVIILPEPVHQWEEMRDEADGKSIIAKFYADPRNYSFPFQMVAYITRISAIRKAVRENPGAVIICERCLDADRNVFATMLRDDGKMDPFLYNIYCRWFNEFDSDWRSGRQVRVYLRARPETCLRRVHKRQREGETVDLAYLEKCHSYHEAWLMCESNVGVKVFDADVDRRSDADYEGWVSEVVGLIST